MRKDAKYVVRLSLDEQAFLRGLISTGQRAASVLSRARILLKADAGDSGPGASDEAVADAVESSASTVHRTRQAFVDCREHSCHIKKSLRCGGVIVSGRFVERADISHIKAVLQ